MKKTIYMNEDNEHFYQYHPAEDMTEEGLRALVDHYADSGSIKGVLFCTNLQRALYDSNVWERFRDIRDDYPEPYTANLDLLAERGLDHFKIWLDQCKKRGLEGWLTMRMNDSHGLKETAIGDTACRCYAWATEYWKEHPELRRAPYRYERDWEGGFDYGKKEVRDLHLALIRELFDRYDMFGFECDWMRWAMMFAPGHEREGQKHLTEFVGEVRKIADEAEKRYGHPIKLAHRIPFDVMTAYNSGYDLVKWHRMGAVDMITLSHFCGFGSFDPPIKFWKQLLPGVVVNVVVEAMTSPFPQNVARDDAFRRGGAACAWYAGADNMYLFNHCYQETTEMAKLTQIMCDISEPAEIKKHSRRTIPAFAGFHIAGEPDGATLPVPLIEPAPAWDTGRMEATVTVRLNAGEFDPEEEAFVKIGFDAATDVDQLLDMPVWFNTVPLKEPVKEDPLAAGPDSKLYTAETKSVLSYRLPAGCLKEEFNALEFLPPAIPGNLVWAELYLNGKTK